MKMLVTGANGYIGQGVVRQLLDDGVDVIATDFECQFMDRRANRKPADLFAVEKPFEYFEKPDALLHLAWRNGFVHNHISHMEDLPRHYLFLRKMMDEGVGQVGVMGSMHEVGFHEGSIREDTPTNPQSLYGVAKDALRRSTALKARESRCVFQWIRGFYIVGNSEFGSSVFSKIAAAEKRGDTEFPFTSGQNQWDFLDYHVFCEQVAAIMEQRTCCGIINACSGHPERLGERAEQFIRDNHFQIRLRYGAFEDRPYDSKAVWGDDAIIRKIMADRNNERKGGPCSGLN